MQLTLAGEYAIRTMIHLAGKEENSTLIISDISASCNIPEKFLRKIIPQLCSAGLLKTQRGIGGGISLGKSPAIITPYQIIEAVEGKMALNKCLIDKEFCSDTRWCTVHTIWCEALAELRKVLSSKSIKELAEENRARKKKLAIPT